MGNEVRTETPVTVLRDAFRAERAVLAGAFEKTHDPVAYFHGHTAALDRAVIGLAHLAGLPEDKTALVAVGGYGRAELYPASDIDLLVLVAREAADDPAVSEKIAAFVTSLWELGLTVGASVRNESDFLPEALKDVSVATTYLENRLLLGSPALYARNFDGFIAHIDPKRFFRDKMLERARRHQKFQETPYALEPNLKESPGGLRDLQVFLWCAQAAGFASTVEGMHRAELITDTEMHQLQECARVLAVMRIALHLVSGRHEDRLLFDVQEELAKMLGYDATAQMRASEALMKRYYLNAKAVMQLSVIELQNLSDRFFGDTSHAEPVPLAPGFVVRGDEMDIASDDVFRKDPHALLRTFALYHSHPGLARLSTRLLRALWHTVPKIDDRFRSDPVNQQTFLDILRMPKGTYHALKLMNDWDVLGRFLPDFRHVVGQMQHDLFHIFTVDQHTLQVVRFIRRFGRSEFAHEYPVCSQVLSDLREPWRLALAGLFHDIGKGTGGRHWETGAVMMADFCRRFGLDQETEDFLVFLVREHLTMNRVAMKEDITDPDTVRRFAALTGTRERLDALYLLTVADVRATSPKIWTPWKAQLLETLYRLTASVLSGADTPRSRESVIEERKAEALRLLGSRVSAEERDALWKEFDLVYFMRHSSREIAWHTEVLAGRIRSETPVVSLHHDEKMSGTVVLVYLPDRRDLFLRAAAALAKNNANVVDARVHTTRDGWALDTFRYTDRYDRTPSEARDKKIIADLTALLSGNDPLPAMPKAKLSRRSKHFPIRPVVKTMPDASGRAWILSVACVDKPGLLFGISKVLADYNVNMLTAKITTLGERAEDVFLVDGAALAEDEALLRLEADLVEAITAS